MKLYWKFMLQVHHSFARQKCFYLIKKNTLIKSLVRGLCPWCLRDTLVGVNDGCSHAFLHRKPKPFLVKDSRQTYSLIKFVQQLCSKIAGQHHGDKSLVDNIRHDRVAFNINFGKLLFPFSYISLALPHPQGRYLPTLSWRKKTNASFLTRKILDWFLLFLIFFKELVIVQYSGTSTSNHLFTRATFFGPGGRSVHSLLFWPLHDGNGL